MIRSSSTCADAVQLCGLEPEGGSKPEGGPQTRMSSTSAQALTASATNASWAGTDGCPGVVEGKSGIWEKSGISITTTPSVRSSEKSKAFALTPVIFVSTCMQESIRAWVGMQIDGGLRGMGTGLLPPQATEVPPRLER